MARFLVTVNFDNGSFEQVLGIYMNRTRLEFEFRNDYLTFMEDDLEADYCFEVLFIDDNDEPYPEWGVYDLFDDGDGSYPPYNWEAVCSLLKGQLPDSLLPEKLRKSKPSSTAKETKHMNLDKLRNAMFCEVSGVVLDGLTGKPSIKSDTGLVSIEFDEKGEHTISVNPVTDLGMELPAFAMATPVEKAERGDIYVTPAGAASFVAGLSGDKLLAVTTNGTNQKITPATNVFFGTKTVLLVKNMFAALSGGEGGMMNPMLLAMIAGKGGGKDDLLKMMLLSQMSAGAGGMNPMMMAVIFGMK